MPGKNGKKKTEVGDKGKPTQDRTQAFGTEVKANGIAVKANGIPVKANGIAVKANGMQVESGKTILPTRETAVFKKLMKSYDERQYKPGLKFAKQILQNPKCCEHAETWAVKGLLLLGLGKRQEAEESVRRAVKNDVRSAICWHSLGLVHKAGGKYDEATKCFRNAVKLDPENLEVWRDISVLQIHTRDLEGFRDSRFSLFQLRPSQRASWSGLALSYHLLGDFDMALKILEEFKKSQQNANRDVVGQFMKNIFNKKNDYDYERSEVLKYQNLVLRESGNAAAALSHLEENETLICDKNLVLETRLTLLLELGRMEQAAHLSEQLIAANPHNTLYYTQLERAKNVNGGESRVDLYKSLLERNPRNETVLKILLENCNLQDFRIYCSRLINKKLEKKEPSSLFISIKSLYSSEAKIEIIEEILANLLMDSETAKVENNSQNNSENYTEEIPLNSTDNTNSSTERNPTESVGERKKWLYYALAQHFDKLKQFPKALDYVNRAMHIDNTIPEFFLLKGKIHKHLLLSSESVPTGCDCWIDCHQSSEGSNAVDAIKQAFHLDPTDRCVGSKYAKYLLRLGSADKAIEVMGTYTKPGENILDYLCEMQCHWFLVSLAHVLYHKHNKQVEGRRQALALAHQVAQHFDDIERDQLDFHLYALTKLRLTSYLGLLRLEDTIRKDKYYISAAILAINCYLDIFDEKSANERNADSISNTPGGIYTENKRVKKKDRQEKPVGVYSSKVLNDNDYESTDDPLSVAVEFLSHLQKVASGNAEFQWTAFNIYLRKRKPLLMLRSMLQLKKIKGSEKFLEKAHTILHRFVEDSGTEFPTIVHQIISENLNI